KEEKRMQEALKQLIQKYKQKTPGPEPVIHTAVAHHSRTAAFDAYASQLKALEKEITAPGGIVCGKRQGAG
ncbi:MAG: hypothetical protein MJA84_16670, partial [Firmicutes bacterium]|nr:hypothetical protein [Bacillota bacterium]